MAKGESKEVVKTGAHQLPDFMRGQVGKGLENLGQGDYEMPRIKLLQGISDELQTHNNAKAGDFFHTLLEESFGPDMLFVPLYTSKRYVLWRPRFDGGGILARADDAVHWEPANASFKVFVDKQKTRQVEWVTRNTVVESGLDKWGSYDPNDPNSPPAATLAYVVVGAFPEHPQCTPSAILLQRSAVPTAKKFFGKLQILSEAPIYGIQFRMVSCDDQNKLGDNFKNYRFDLDGFVKDKDVFERYRILHENFKRTGVQVKDLENTQEDMPAEGSNSAGREKAEAERSF